ncbi:MAG: methylenetetrahydrofolate reductase [Acidobacteria bacterium]|nr:methylenetetrahydrofolate reductase [Acidobacteriota bacterium]
MSLAGVFQRKQQQGEKVFSVEISPPMNYPGLVKTSEMVEALKDLDLDSIALTNNTGGSFKLNPLAVVETVQATLRGVPIILHITSRDEGSVRTVYTHVDNMALNGVSDVLVIRGDPSPTNSRQTDAYKFSTVELVKYMSDYSRQQQYPLDIFVAGHPEWQTTLTKHMLYQRKKIDSGAKGIIANIVAASENYSRYVEAAQAHQIDVPVLPSVIPLTSLARCEFLEKQLHIPIPETVKEKLARCSNKEEARRVGVELSGDIAEELLRQSALGVNFNVIFPQDVKSVKELLQRVRGYGTIWEKYQIEDPEEIDYFKCLREGYF